MCYYLIWARSTEKRGRKSKDKRTIPVEDSQIARPWTCGCLMYSLFFWLNVIALESVLMAIECVLRIALLLVLALFLNCAPIWCTGSYSSSALPISKEIIINLAVLLSLASLGCTAWAFRKFSDFEDWDLLPIPTVIGAVDLRRYFTVYYGHGNLASNVLDFSPTTSQDAWKGSYVISPQKLLDDLAETARGR